MEEPPNSDGALIENSLFSLELAKTDSPFYRANISQFQVELDALTKWLDGLCRGLRLYTENMLKTNEVQRSVISKLIAQSSSDLIERSITRMTGDALQHININKAKMIDDINEQLIEPFQGFLKQDVKEIKEVSRSYDRRLERYENATARYAGLSRSKDSSALREEAFVLYEIRKQYLRASFEFTHQIILFRVRSHSLMMGNLMSLINSHCEFHDSSWKVVKELVPVLAKLKSNLEETVRVRNHGAAKLDSQRRNIEEETVVKAKPQVTPGVSQTQAPEGTVGVKSVMRSTPVPGIPGAETPPEKEGYLWKKTIGTKGLTTLSWHRVWFMLKNGGISYCLVSGKQGGVVLGTPALNILLCSVRVARGEDRRFCFELSTVKTRHNILLQAESEDEMNNWITAIEAAKYAAAGQPSANSLIGEALIGEEDDEGVPLREIRLSSVTHDLIHNPQLGVEEEEDDDDDGGGILGEAEGPEKVTDSALPSPEDQPKLVYNDSALKKDNVKLHRLLKSVPANDWVIDAFSCAMQKEIGVQGRVYVTYDRVCFYSNILGFVKIFVAELKTLVSVVQRKGPLSATIIVTTPETSIGFLTILKDDTHYFNLKAAWQNSLVDDENRLRPQELLDSFNRNKSSEAGLEGQEDKEPSLADSPMVTSPKDFRIPPVNSEFEPPPGFQPPIGEEVCGCDDHLEKKELDLVLHAPAKQVFEILFGNDPSFWTQKFHPRRGESGRTQGQWSEGPNSTREVKYTMQVNNPMVKAKEADVLCSEKIMKKSEYLVYVVEAQSSTPSVPYGDAFSPITRYCITWLSKTSCRLVITCGIKFFKNPLVKGMIKSAAFKGLADGAADCAVLLQQAIGDHKGKVSGDLAHAAEFDAVTPSISKVMQSHAASRDTQDSSKNSDFLGISSRWIVNALLLLLCCSLLMNVRLYRHPSPHHSITTIPNMWAQDWSRMVKNRYSSLVTKSFESFANAHFLPINGNWTTFLRNKNERQGAYSDDSHQAMQLRLAEAHVTLGLVEQELKDLLEIARSLEGQIVWIMYINWVAEVGADCRSVPRKGCDSVSLVIREISQRSKRTY